MTSMEIIEDGERVEDGALHISMQLTTNIFAPWLRKDVAQPEEVTPPLPPDNGPAHTLCQTAGKTARPPSAQPS